MVINWILWIPEYEDKITVKHGVDRDEVAEILYGQASIRRVGKGRVTGEDLYMGLGQTYEGRYLTILFHFEKRQCSDTGERS